MLYEKLHQLRRLQDQDIRGINGSPELRGVTRQKCDCLTMFREWQVLMDAKPNPENDDALREIHHFANLASRFVFNRLVHFEHKLLHVSTPLRGPASKLKYALQRRVSSHLLKSKVDTFTSASV